MGARHWIGAAAVIILAATVKAHMLFMRLVILAAAGLAGLFLLHTLAQDYRKIQQNRPKAFGLFKRSLPETTEVLFGADMETKFSAAQKEFEKLQEAKIVESNDLSLLGAAAHLDPQGCAQSYICLVAAKPQESLTSLERALLDLIRRSPKDAIAFHEAARLGRKYGDSKACKARYSRCSFSVTEMLRLIQPVY